VASSHRDEGLGSIGRRLEAAATFIHLLAYSHNRPYFMQGQLPRKSEKNRQTSIASVSAQLRGERTLALHLISIRNKARVCGCKTSLTKKGAFFRCALQVLEPVHEPTGGGIAISLAGSGTFLASSLSLATWLKPCKVSSGASSTGEERPDNTGKR
jgi:hypothetical protein